MWTSPVKIFKDLGRASPRLPVYIKKKKNMYEPNPLHLEPSDVFIQQVEWSGAARITSQGGGAFLPSSPS